MGNPQEANQLVSKEQVEAIVGHSIAPDLLQDLNSCMVRYEINTAQRKRHFISQCAHESGGFQWFLEFASGDDYEGRNDLGNTTPGDGRKYKGAGALQVTGRFNYMVLFRDVNDPKVIEQGAAYVSKKYPFTAAGIWWKRNNMNALCDQDGVTVEDVTRRVNGGTNGLVDRISYYAIAQKEILK